LYYNERSLHHLQRHQWFIINIKLLTLQTGTGPVIFSWQKQGNYLAVAGANRRVQIFDRQGKIYHQISLTQQGTVITLDWDKEGEVLAILQKNTGMVPLWNLNTKKLENLDTNMKELSFLKWSIVGPQLAIGSVKGTLLLYNRKTMKKIPIKGKHTKKITCGAWNSENLLGLGSDDMQVTLSNVSGDTLYQANLLHFQPSQLQFGRSKNDEKTKDTTMSLNLGKSIWLYDIANSKQKEQELVFHERYGKVITYRWFIDG
jgi:WD repeat-containing protein 19